MGDLAGELAGKSKAGGSRFGRSDGTVASSRRGVERRIHFDGREMACIKFEPMRLRQIMRIKDTSPVSSKLHAHEPMRIFC